MASPRGDDAADVSVTQNLVPEPPQCLQLRRVDIDALLLHAKHRLRQLQSRGDDVDRLTQRLEPYVRDTIITTNEPVPRT